MRACERLGIKMFDGAWQDLDWWTQTVILAFEQIREYEEGSQ